MYKHSNLGWMKHLDFIILDEIALQLAFILAYAIRQGGGMPYTSQDYRLLAVLYAVADLLVAVLFSTMHNVLRRGYYQEFLHSLKQALLTFLGMTLFMFSSQTGDIYSRITVFLTAAFHLLLGYGLRLAWKPIIRRIGNMIEKSTMILVADEAQVPAILSRVTTNDDIAYTGLVLSNRDGTGEEIAGVKVVASLETAADYIGREWVDEVFVYPKNLSELDVPEEGAEAAPVAALIIACRQMALPVHIRIPVSDGSGKRLVEKVGGYNVLTLASGYATPLQLAVKRAFDILGGLAGSVIALIVIAVFAPKIKKESPGPILFKQTRIGKNGKKFTMYKIRSMYMDAEERKKELLADNRVSDGMMFKLDWDPRVIGNKIVDGKQVTGIGEKIHSGSWDECPQFFNVLFGQMSLVGTRPPTVDEWEKYKYHHRARLAAKPGLTGMWQVSGRSKITDFEEVVKLDTEYINDWSVALDIKILLKTVKAVFKKEGAL